MPAVLRLVPGGGSAAYPGLFSLAGAAGSATGLSLRSLRTAKIFSWPRATPFGAGCAGALLLPAGKHLRCPGRPVALPPYCACLPFRRRTHHEPGPRHRDHQRKGARHGRHHLSLRGHHLREALLRRHDHQLRRTARMIALAGNLTGDTTLMAIALMAQLIALAAAVAELRQAQQHAAQAAAARAAAAHLHSAITEAGSQVPPFGRAHATRSAKTASAAHAARRAFPAGWKPNQPPTAGEDPQGSDSPPQSRRIPSQRASPGRGIRYG